MSIAPKSTRFREKRTLIFALISVLFIIINYAIFEKLFKFSLKEETWSHIPLIPLISVFFFFRARKEIFGKIACSIAPGSIVILIGFISIFCGMILKNSIGDIEHLSLSMLSFLISFYGAFLLCFGNQAFNKALFPLLFLLFMIPLPPFFERLVVGLFRFGSIEMVNVYFSIAGVLFIREGSVFHLEGLSFNVADQCSGIRSGLSLFIVSVIAAKLFLRTARSRTLFLLTVVPIAWIKNGMRIATLTLLGCYVNSGFLHGPLHQQGGKPFFLIGLALLGLALFTCRVVEKKIWQSSR
jgi:exosortase